MSSGVNWPASAGSAERTSALSFGVTELLGSLFSCPGVTLRPRLASTRGFSPGSETFCFGREKMPKKSSNNATQTPISRNSDLLLSRPSSCRLSAGFCCRRAVWKAERNASRQFPLPVSSGADSSLAISVSGFAGAVFSSLFVSSVSMVCCLPQYADSKTGRRQGRFDFYFDAAEGAGLGFRIISQRVLRRQLLPHGSHSVLKLGRRGGKERLGARLLCQPSKDHDRIVDLLAAYQGDLLMVRTSVQVKFLLAEVTHREHLSL